MGSIDLLDDTVPGAEFSNYGAKRIHNQLCCGARAYVSSIGGLHRLGLESLISQFQGLDSASGLGYHRNNP